MPKVGNNTVGLMLLIIFNFNIVAVSVGQNFRIDQLADRVSEKLKERSPWYSSLFRSNSELTVNGIGLVLAFEKRGIYAPVSPSADKHYTIRDLLYQIDQRICIELVNYKHEHGYKDWSNFSERDFRELNNIQKKYLDVLSEVLEQKYGTAAKFYLDEINRSRAEFESCNNGYLLEQISDN